MLKKRPPEFIKHGPSPILKVDFQIKNLAYP